MNSLAKTIWMASTAMGLIALAPLACAQGAPPAAADATPNDMIIVTAQKREQTLIDVPQSISVVSAETLQNRSVNNISDFINTVPSLQLVQSTPGQGRIILRGINTGGVASTVAVYVDETPFGSSSGLANGAELAGDFDTFDLARIEVLRGPQGTLYGASSLGGLVKYVTNAPDATKWEARARGNVETTDGGAMSYQGNAMINIPLSETLAFRASGSYRKQGGFIDSIGTSGSDVDKNINDFVSYGVRASLQWTPSDTLKVRASALLQNINVDAPSRVEVDPATLKPLYGGLTQAQYVPSYSNVRYRLYNLLIEKDFGAATVTSSTSYGEQLQRRRDDQTTFINNLIAIVGPSAGLPPLDADVYQRQTTNNKKWTQELRLASNGGGVLDWLVGGYYTHEDALIDQQILAVNRGTLTLQPYLAEFGGIGGANQPSNYEEYAGFANATLHLGKHFDIDLGGRYSHNDQSTSQTGTGVLGAPVPLSGSSSDNVFTYSVAPKFKFNDRASLYARVARGYRPGGPNTIPPGAPANVPFTFGPDRVTSYEVGFKGETADRTLSVDAAVFRIDWTDIQLFGSVNNYGVNINGSSARVNGAEANVTLRPTTGLSASINAAYNDAVLTGDTDPVTLGAVDGDRLPFTPQYTVSMSADYDWSVGDGVTASLGGTIRTVSEQSGPYQPDQLAAYGRFARIPSYEQVDLRASLDFARFSLQAYVKNLTDARGVTAVLGQTSNSIPLSANGAQSVGILRPRTIGFSVTTGF